MDVTIEQLEEDLYRHIVKKRPLFIHGSPGIGKSDTVRTVARRLAREKQKPYQENVQDPAAFVLIDVRLSQMDPTDLTGLPFREGDTTAYLRPKWLPTGGEGVVLLDELPQAPPLTQSSALQLILDRRLGDYTLPPGWAIIAAGNRLGDRTHSFETSTALNNRFDHATLLPPGEPAWREWMFAHQGHPDVVAFVASNPQWLYKFDPATKDPAFPTHRSWFGCSEMLAGLAPDSEAAVAQMYRLTGEAVGQGAALAFKGFLIAHKAIDLDDLLKHPEKVTKLKENEVLFALSSGLASRYGAAPKLLDPILAVISYVTAEDLAVFALRLLRGQRPNAFGEEVVRADHWKVLSGRFRKFLL